MRVDPTGELVSIGTIARNLIRRMLPADTIRLNIGHGALRYIGL